LSAYLLALVLSLSPSLSPMSGGEGLSAAPLAGSIESSFMLPGERTRGEEESERELIKSGLRSSWEVRPSVDYALNDHISVGGELGLGWLGVLDDAEAGAARRFTLTPHARLRMDFPLSCSLVLEGVMGVGFSTWGEAQGVTERDGGARHWGFSFRMSLGLRYLINTDVSALFGAGYLQQELYQEDHTMSLRATPVTLGLRSAF